MLTYLVRRLLAAFGLLLVITLITFWIFFVLPQWAGQTPQSMAAGYVGRQQNPAALQAVIDRFGFDKPLFVQYFDYVAGIVGGRTYSDGVSLIHCNAPCFGYSFKNFEQVWPTLLSRAPVTVSIAIGAGVLWLVFGVLSGVISAVRKGSLADRASMGIALAGVALPVYFVGPLLEAITGQWSTKYVPFLSNPLQWAQHLLIPWIALAFGYAALYARMTRAGMLDALNEDFVRTARAKGVRERKVLYKHALRSALTPIITIFGMDLGFALGGVALAEQVFNLPGIGREAVDAVNQADLPVLMGVTIVATAFIVLANLVVDLLYGAIDPRVRAS